MIILICCLFGILALLVVSVLIILVFSNSSRGVLHIANHPDGERRVDQTLQDNVKDLEEYYLMQQEANNKNDVGNIQ